MTTPKTLTLPYSRHFLEWLHSQQVSLALTTYQTNRLCFIGVQPDGQIFTPVWEFDRPMGLYATAERFYLATRYQIWRFQNVLETGELLQDKYDRLYVPRVAYTTGDLDVHDLITDSAGNIIFANTEYSCLGTLHPQHSFTPIWKPDFITKLAPEDRCHLNGLAAVNGIPRYVTAVSRSDVASGWRHRRSDGGIVIDIQTQEIVASGLSMPHSPRWYRGKLWLLNSGAGDFGYVENGEFVPVTFCPGYGRGLAFVGDFAVVGLSKPRDYHFSGLSLGERLRQKDAEARCGIVIIDLKTGDIVEWLDMDTEATELYDTAVLPGVRCPMSLGLKSGNIAKLVTIGKPPEVGKVASDSPPAITPASYFYRGEAYSPTLREIANGQEISESEPTINNPNVSPSPQYLPNWDASAPSSKTPSEYFLQRVLFRSVNWQEKDGFVAAIALACLHLNKPFNFLEVGSRRSPQETPQTSPAIALFERGQDLKKQGKFEEAIACFQQAIQTDPSYIPARNNLGTLLQNRGRLNEAIACYQQALQLNPNLPQTLTNLASIYLLQGQFEPAEELLTRALKLKADFVPALYNLGLLYKQQAKLEEAIALFQTAAKHQRNYADAYFQLGQIWEFQEKFILAKLAYERVQQLNPSTRHLTAHIGFVQLNLCQWKNYDRFVRELINSTTQYVREESGGFTLAPFQLNAVPLPPEFSLGVARKHAAAIEKSVAGKNLQFTYPQKTDKLRVGYVSGDFREHAVGRLISRIFENHNRERVEVFGYNLLNVGDRVAETIQKGCDEFRDISHLSAADAARRVHRDGIHILIDLAGYTGYSKPEIFACKPAPVQAGFLGYPQTMGASFIPYLLADKWVVPPELAEYYSEEIVYLPHQFVCSPMEISQKRFTRGEVGLPEESFVFACFNRHYKITPDLFAAWMRILQQVESSVLWLSAPATEEVIENLRHQAVAAGVAPERLIFAPKIPHPEYLARLQLADLGLDTWIYNGGSTTIAALWAGLPVLTKPGFANASRMGASICASAGIADTICYSVEQYEQKAVYWATHPQELQQLRQRLQVRNAPLFDVAGFVAHLEEAFQQMWNR